MPTLTCRLYTERLRSVAMPLLDKPLLTGRRYIQGKYYQLQIYTYECMSHVQERFLIGYAARAHSL